MKIEFLLEEKSLLSANYIKLIHKRDFDKIVIKRDQIKSVNLDCREIFNGDLIINVSFKSFLNSYNFNISDIVFKTNEIVLIGILDDPLRRYRQGYIDNFKLLSDQKENIKWYELNDKQKYYYLRGCYLLNGIRKDIDDTNAIIVIDLSKARVDLDVYYEIGKAFFKSYGYFGTEFHSFRDYLINIDESIRKREKIPILRIKGYKNFEKYFSDNILFTDFYAEFAASGFEIQNSK
ncbi:hypothetical protein [uncultured Chryseobacterium sp.]|uniref:hypothetical protein n=1 Tax=uncultured Chryseobacterium sp. TaxID=259322 RepID=UPI0025CD11D7|nr:hypothetical protein [uncultured Chryseobacterium sp.]